MGAGPWCAMRGAGSTRARNVGAGSGGRAGKGTAMSVASPNRPNTSLSASR